MRYSVVALALLALVACGAEEEIITGPVDTKPSCSSGLVANDYGYCVSAEPYACGWKRNNPGALRAGGSRVGDVVENLKLVDQCSEEVELWDFYGEYDILWMTAAW